MREVSSNFWILVENCELLDTTGMRSIVTRRSGAVTMEWSIRYKQIDTQCKQEVNTIKLEP